jgi:WS/DGAT/MGAT family acyltransferase
MPDTLTALDATFLELEELDGGALMNIGGTMVFEPLPGGGAPTIEDVRAHLAVRLERLARYSQRLSSTRVGDWSWPHWTDDEGFDIRSHVYHQALPAPGSDVQLCDWTANFFSHQLDRTRPLWEMVLLEGLEHGRWALGWKTHHCMVDGVGSVDVIDLMLDSEPSPNGHEDQRPPADERLPTEPAAPGARRTVPLPHPLESIVQAARAGASSAGAGVRAVAHPIEAIDRSRALAELIVRDEIVGAPHTSLNVPIGPTRRYGVVRVPLAELKAIGRELGASVNDVVLASCAAGLRSLLLGRGEELPAHGLRAMVPMNLRGESGRLSLGNQVTSLFVDLPVAQPDPRTRLQEIAVSMKRLKESGAGEGARALIDLAEVSPPIVVQAALARTLFASRLFNVTITNVPGSRAPLYAFGSLLREVHPFVPLAAKHAVGVAVLSYNGLVTFGISADSGSVPDLDVLAYGIEDGLEELGALVPDIVKIHQEMRV